MSNLFRPVSPINSSFLPEDYVARKTETRVNILILGLFALVLAGVVAAFVVTNRTWQSVRTRRVNVNDQWAVEGKKMDQLRSLEAQRAQMMEKAEITAALVEHVPRWAVLGEITLRMPLEMRLDTLTIKSTRTEPAPKLPATGPTAAPTVKSLTDRLTGTTPVVVKPKVQAPRFTYVLTIVGNTAKNADVADFLAGLKSSPILSNVELTYISELKEKDKELRKFEISAAIRSDTDTNVLAASLQKLVAERTSLLEGGKDTVDPRSVGPQAPAKTADGTPEGGN